MSTNRKALVIGCRGQIGIELAMALRSKLGQDNVIGADIQAAESVSSEDRPYVQLNVLDAEALRACVQDHAVTQVYQLAALLSATGEKNPMYAWKLNMEGLLNILELAKEFKFRLFWPSSIAAFGPTTPADQTPQTTVMEPSSVYGISKLAGERWCEYYFMKYGVDVRSLRYPGSLCSGRRNNRLRRRYFLLCVEGKQIHIISFGKHGASHDDDGRRHSSYHSTDGIGCGKD